MRKLSELLAMYRTDRPDEWAMDEFKRAADALEAENARLRAEIDAANAQEPFCTITHTAEDDLKTYRTELHYRDDVTIASIPSHLALYARPIPAQQSQVSGEYENALKDLQEYLGYESISAEDRKMLSRVIHV